MHEKLVLLTAPPARATVLFGPTHPEGNPAQYSFNESVVFTQYVTVPPGCSCTGDAERARFAPPLVPTTVTA